MLQCRQFHPHLCHIVCFLFYLLLIDLPHAQGKCDIVVHAHIGIQRIILKYHGEIPLPRLLVILDLSVHPQLARRDVLQTCDHAQQRRFPAAGRSNQNQKFSFFYLKRKVMNCFITVPVYFSHMF